MVNHPNRSKKIEPDPQDFDAVKNEKASDAEKYRLAQTHKLMRLYDHGLLPVEEMREIDKILDKILDKKS